MAVNLKRKLLSGPSRANFVFGPMFTSARKEPKNTSHTGHIVGRQLFDKMRQLEEAWAAMQSSRLLILPRAPLRVHAR